MQIVSIGDNLHEMPLLFSGKRKKKYQFSISILFHSPFRGGFSVMVYFCYSLSLNVCVAYIFLFWIAIWPLCGKATIRLAFR